MSSMLAVCRDGSPRLVAIPGVILGALTALNGLATT